MGIGDLLDFADDLDPRKAIELADDLWDDRDKIGDVVGWVWENKDKLSEAIEWIGDHGDDLIDLAKRLPDLLGSAGDALDAAGDGAMKAAHFLTGGGDGDGAVNALTDVAADALERCRKELNDVQKLISRLGGQLDDIKIPTISTKKSEIAGFSVISGVDIGSVGLLGKATNQLGGGAEKISSVADDLATVAKQLRQVGASVTDAGGDLETVGDRLSTSGVALKQLTAGPAKKTTKKPAKSTSSRKTTSKKTPAKKKSSTKKKATPKATTRSTKK